MTPLPFFGAGIGTRCFFLRHILSVLTFSIDRYTHPHTHWDTIYFIDTCSRPASSYYDHPFESRLVILKSFNQN